MIDPLRSASLLMFPTTATHVPQNSEIGRRLEPTPRTNFLSIPDSLSLFTATAIPRTAHTLNACATSVSTNTSADSVAMLRDR